MKFSNFTYGFLFSSYCILQKFPAQLVDKESFLSLEWAALEFVKGMELLGNKRFDTAQEHLVRSYETVPLVGTAYQIALNFQTVRDTQKAAYWFQEALRLKNDHAPSLLELGILVHYDGRDLEALDLYVKAINSATYNENITVEALYNIGVSYQHLGRVQESAEAYDHCLNLQPNHIRARINLAALHQKYGDVEEAIHQYKLGLEHSPTSGLVWSLISMIHTNLGAAYYQTGQHTLALQHQNHMQLLLNSALNSNCAVASDEAILSECEQMRIARDVSMGHSLVVMRAICFWKDYEKIWTHLLSSTITNAMNRIEGPFLPFNTLLLPVSLSNRLLIARAASATIRMTAFPPISLRPFNTSDSHQIPSFSLRAPNSIRLGLLSYDFNSHPTCQLAVSLLTAIRTIQTAHLSPTSTTEDPPHRVIEIFTYSYGKDDSSHYRQQMVQLSDTFQDISLLGTLEAADAIRADSIDILIDMQGHTMGHRLEITAARPAPIQVNYLIFPGTSGADFLDYIIGDRIVSPAEHAEHYSESFLLMPPTYQIPVSPYAHQSDRRDVSARPGSENIGIGSRDSSVHGGRRRGEVTRLRSLYGLPPLPTPVLCNFNVADKLSPDTLSVWMQIMRRLPGSVLWLLLPKGNRQERGGNPSGNSTYIGEETYSEEQNVLVMRSIRSEAAAHGILPERVIYASRVSKSEHILRHAAADLFVDGFFYGAHSTATDALRGGLPVLTMVGGSYPARVAASLYDGIICEDLCDDSQNQQSVMTIAAREITNVMVATSVTEYEDTAVRLLRRPTDIWNSQNDSQNNQHHLSSILYIIKIILEIISTNDIYLKNRTFDELLAARKFILAMKTIIEVEVQRSKGLYGFKRPHIFTSFTARY